MKKALFPLFAVFPVVFAGAGCAGQEAKADFSVVPQISSQELLQVRELLKKAEIQKQKAALNEALVKDNQKLKEENAKLDQKVEKLAKTAKAESSSLKEFDETNSFIKKFGEAFKPAPPKTEEAKKKKLLSLAHSLIAEDSYDDAQLAEKRWDWANKKISKLDITTVWFGVFFDVKDKRGKKGARIEYWQIRRSFRLCYYLKKSVFISDNELMKEYSSPAPKSPKKGKTKLL